MPTVHYDSEAGRSRHIEICLEGLNPSRIELTSWEEGFVASVEDLWRRKNWMSNRQYEVLKKLYREKGNPCD